MLLLISVCRASDQKKLFSFAITFLKKKAFTLLLTALFVTKKNLELSINDVN